MKVVLPFLFGAVATSAFVPAKFGHNNRASALGATSTIAELQQIVKKATVAQKYANNASARLQRAKFSQERVENDFNIANERADHDFELAKQRVEHEYKIVKERVENDYGIQKARVESELQEASAEEAEAKAFLEEVANEPVTIGASEAPAVADETASKEAPSTEKSFHLVQEAFPGAVTNAELLDMINGAVEGAGYDMSKTLVATSLCCDEVNRPLETDLSANFDYNFQMGGLAGFPFGGATSFGAMAAHIPDGGSCVVVYGPHVGVDSTGAVGTVERRGRANGGSCCGSAVAASGYVGSVLAGEKEADHPEDALDAQQFYVGSMLMPFAEDLGKADDKMVELPKALYKAQSDLMERIVKKSAGGVADGQIAVLGGIQINTPPGYSDYFLPKSFDLYNNKGEKIADLMLGGENMEFPKAAEAFPGALTNTELLAKIQSTLKEKGYDADKTLVATSLCCDEVNRPLETDLADAFDTNFNMGGLAGFPFGGATSFGAMAAHIPDGGDCCVVFGPHVGVDSTGKVGTVERRGRANGGSCCGSAVAAAGYVGSVFNGEAKAAHPDDVLDAQQYYVGSMLMPFAEQLESADNKMVELPMALYNAQAELMERIVQKSAGGVADGQIAVLGGIQINTPPGYTDYFLPQSFDLYNNKGEKINDLMPTNILRPFPKVKDVFPGALSNAELVSKVKATLAEKGYDDGKTLVATSLCCDEVNRPLETNLADAFDTNFQMGGLAGFPFGGAISFGVMALPISLMEVIALLYMDFTLGLTLLALLEPSNVVDVQAEDLAAEVPLPPPDMSEVFTVEKTRLRIPRMLLMPSNSMLDPRLCPSLSNLRRQTTRWLNSPGLFIKHRLP